MPVTLRTERAKSARAQGVESLVPGSQSGALPKSRPKPPTRVRTKTPAPLSSQVDRDDAETVSVSSEDRQRPSSAQPTSPVEPREDEYESAAEEPTQVDEGGAAASISKKKKRNKEKGKAAVRDLTPTDDELRAVRATIQITVDKRVIHNERWHFKEVNFNTLQDLTLELVEDWRQEKIEAEPGYPFTVTSISRPTITVSCYGIKDPEVFPVQGDISIQESEAEVYRLVQLGKRDIRLLATWDFKTVEQPRHDPPGEVQRQRDEEDFGGRTPGPTASGRKRAHTKEDATRRQRRQTEYEAAVETATGSFATQITGKWQCHDKTCGNVGFCCFPLGRLGHLRITGPELVQWNEAIRGGRATLEQPPTEVIAACVQRKSRREGRKGGSPSKNSSSGGPTIININAGGVGVASAHSEIPRSSPPLCDGGELENLQAYLQWLVSKGHLARNTGRLAEEALVREAWGFQQIRSISPNDWMEMGIPKGARMIISSKQKLWIAAITEQAIRDAATRSGRAEGDRFSVLNSTDSE